MTEQQRFEALVRPHLDGLMGFANRRVANRADAEDLVQTAIMRAWKAFGTLRDPSSVAAWLFSILRSTISDHRQRVARRRGIVELAELDDRHAESVEAPGLGPLEEVIRTLSGRRLREALADLPEVYGTAVELHDIHGFQYREIADILDVPVGSVMSRLHRGRKLLARTLVRDFGGSDLSRSHRTP